MDNDCEVEYGTSGDIGFPDSLKVSLKDSKGNPILCKCGKYASCAAIGLSSYIAWCYDCYSMPKFEAEFIYKDPIKDNQ